MSGIQEKQKLESAPNVIVPTGTKVKYLKQKNSYFGENNPKWRGGRIKMKDGRILIYMPEHPNANCCGGTHILEYRFIAEQITGRPLFDGEIVHHKNGDVSDNRVENLEVLTQSDHVRTHFAGELSPNHKLTAEKVRFIRGSELSLPKLSKLLGVSISAIWKVRIGSSWKSIL